MLDVYEIYEPEDDEEYDRVISTLREELKEYYGSAMGVHPGLAVIKLGEIESMSDDEIQEEAVKTGLAAWK
jgi:hypothetical protein